MTAPAIILNNVSARQYGKKILDNISFALSPGEHLGIIGESGSGKSSLLKAIAGKLFVTGTLEIKYHGQSPLGRDTVLIEHSDAFRNLSNVSDFYYQQRYNSCDAEDALTVEAELNRFGLLNNHTDILLEKFNLVHRRQTPLIQLSNGEQKKIQLIKAIASAPQVLLLDKVFTGLDRNSRNLLHDIINELAASGTTIITVTDEREIPSCITHIAELSNGTVSRFIQKKNFSVKQPGLTKSAFDPQPAFALFQPAADKYDWIVKMNQVSIRYGDKTVLFNIDWEVRQGERWLLTGPNGAGKSTLLSLVTADNPQAYSQQIYLFDKKRGSGESIWDIKKNIGFVSPELHRYFDFGTPVHHVVASGLFDTMGLFRRLSDEQEQLVRDWLHFFELTADSSQPLYLLPAGKQRRALLARALIKNPVLLVLDEPCQGLDEQQAGQFLQLIADVCNRSTTTLVYVSHYDNEIPGCITHKIELNQGKQVRLYPEQALTA